MRMWLVDPRVMCRQHLLGEHVELHMLVGHIRLKRAMGKFVTTGLVDTRKIAARHKALVGEMGRRGYNHQSPLHYTDLLKQGHVDVKASLVELVRRCPECRSRVKVIATNR